MAERDENEDLNEESAKSDEDLEMKSDTVLAALNFVLILSSLSSSDADDEQRLNLEESEERESGNWSKNSGSRARRQPLSGLSRALERQQTSKLQPKIRDCRHSRRL